MANNKQHAVNIEAKNILQSLENDVQLVPPKIREWWINYLHNHYYRYLDAFSFLNKNDEKRKILEIGSVPGHFIVLLKRMGYDVQGVDIDPTRIKQIWDKYNVLVEKVDIENESLPFPPNSFDVIFFMEMLEHLRLNPLFALREIHRILKPDGRIILSTPNITLIHRLFFLLGENYQGNPIEEFKKLEWLGHMGHIRLYSFKEVESFLKEVGFKIVLHTYKGHTVGGMTARLMTSIYPKKSHFYGYLYVVGNKE